MAVTVAWAMGAATLASVAAVRTAPSADAEIMAGFETRIVLKGLKQPSSLEFSPDGRVFISELSGLVKVFSSLSDTTASVLLDLRTATHSVDGRGLLSIELHPQFPVVPYLYVFYTRDAPIGGTAPVYGVPNQDFDSCVIGGTCIVGSRLSRFEVRPDNTVGPEITMIEAWCQQWTNHSVGGMAFGDDGMLYVGHGDGAFAGQPDYGQRGSTPNMCEDPTTGYGVAPTLPTAEGGALRSQDFRTTGDPLGLDGTILRIDPMTGDGLPDNPMGSSSDPNARRVIGYGVRNPFRMTFRPGTNELYFGDVGWNHWEELNRFVDPTDGVVDNFGWPCYEGPDRAYDLGLNLCESLYAQGANAITAPYWAHSQQSTVAPADACGTGGAATSGMVFYQGGAYPEQYDGALFMADYARKCVWVLYPGSTGAPDPSTIKVFFKGETIDDLEIGPGGDLYMLDMFGGGAGGGNIIRVSYPAGDLKPSARASATPDQGEPPLDVFLDGTASEPSVPNGVLIYAWDADGDGDFDDGSEPTLTYRYPTSGAFTARLKVTDAHGSDIDLIPVSVGTPPAAVITSPNAALAWRVGDTIVFSGTGFQGATELDPSSLDWTLVLHHCDTFELCHEHLLANTHGVTSGTFEAPDHEYPVYLEVRLEVTNAVGLVDTEAIYLYPKSVDVTVDTAPSGMRATFNDTTAITPFSVRVLEGSVNTVSLNAAQNAGGQAYEFESWSDGGAVAHDVVADATGTIVATFAESDRPVPFVSYSFDIDNGSVVRDDSGNGRDGAIVGAKWTALGHSGAAMSFDGAGDVINLDPRGGFDGSTGFTVEAWVKPKLKGSRPLLSLFRKRTGSAAAWSLWSSSSVPRPSGTVAMTKSTVGVVAPAQLPKDQWSHLALTWDKTTLRLYVNGVLVRSLPASGTMVPTAGLLRIGGAQGVSAWFSGLIDEVQVYTSALSESDLANDIAGSSGAFLSASRFAAASSYCSLVSPAPVSAVTPSE